MALLEVKDLHTSFFTDAGEVRAVNGVSFNLERGKVLGIVGESAHEEKPQGSLGQGCGNAASGKCELT